MNKKEFISAVAKKSGLAVDDVTAVVNASLEVIGETMKKGEKLSFIGFGSFEPTTRAARTAKVPNSDKVVDIPESKSVKFKVGKKLKESVNS